MLTCPDYTKDGQAIAQKNQPWNAKTDAHSQANWQIAVGQAVNAPGGRIIQGSNSLEGPPQWGAATLIKEQNATAMGYLKIFSHHNYPGAKDVAGLMNHAGVVRNLARFAVDIRAAAGVGREYVFGETNSGTFSQ